MERSLVTKLGENRRRWKREKMRRENDREEQRSCKSGRGERSSRDRKKFGEREIEVP